MISLKRAKIVTNGTVLFFVTMVLMLSFLRVKIDFASAAETNSSLSSTFISACFAGSSEIGDVVFLHLDEQLDVFNEKEERLAALADFDFEGAVPIYYISTQATAEALKVYLLEQEYADGIVCSKNKALVKSVRESVTTVRGMLDFRGDDIDMSVRAQVIDIRDAVNTSHANTALISGSDINASAVRTLQSLLITIFVEVKTESEARLALASGVNGILSEFTIKINDLFIGLEGQLQYRRPFLISHRGSSGLKRGEFSYYENTVPAAKAALLEGGAEIIEIDIYLTKDEKIVVMHDDTLDRTTTGKGKIESYTSEELKQYKVDGGKGADVPLDDIPMLTDFFDALKSNDAYYFIEVKGSNSKIIDALAAVMREYEDMSGYISIISFNKNHLTRVRELLPQLSVGFLTNELSSVITGSDACREGFVGEVMAEAGALNATFNPDFGCVNAIGARELLKRGVTTWTWTYRSAEYFKRELFYGYGGLTSDYTLFLTKGIKNVYISKALPEGDSADVEVVHYDGTKAIVNAKVFREIDEHYSDMMIVAVWCEEREATMLFVPLEMPNSAKRTGCRAAANGIICSEIVIFGVILVLAVALLSIRRAGRKFLSIGL